MKSLGTRDATLKGILSSLRNQGTQNSRKSESGRGPMKVAGTPLSLLHWEDVTGLGQC